MDDPTGLLLRAKDGDDGAYAAFVRAMYPSVWRLCRFLVGPDEASDAAQETFISAWRSLSSFRGDASARTWIFVIARRRAERSAAQTSRWRALTEQVPRPSPSASPEQAAEMDELLKGLPMERRVAIVLTQVLGLSYAEAARACGCPVGTIRSRVARARSELLEEMKVGRESRRTSSSSH